MYKKYKINGQLFEIKWACSYETKFYLSSVQSKNMIIEKDYHILGNM